MIESGRIGDWKVQYFKETGSTNDLALAWQGDPVVFVADRQTAGRGRLGRVWESAAATGLYFSVIVPDFLLPAAENLPQVTLAAGMAVVDAVNRLTNAPVGIKWPNDILIDGRKVAGILTETTAGSTRVVIGIGVNVAGNMVASSLAGRAGSLAGTTGQSPERGLLLREILKCLVGRLGQLRDQGFSVLRREWAGRDACCGKKLTWLTVAGHLVHGIGAGLDDQGCLLVRDDLGVLHQVLSGDINLAASAAPPQS